MEFKNFVLVVAYVPNAGEGLKRLQYRITKWDVDFHTYLKQLETERGKPVILTGDLNVAHNEIDIYDTKGKEKVPGYTPEERQSFGKLLSSGFVDTFRHLYPDLVKYTFWSVRQNLRVVNKGWRLDYFLISLN
jgi:exodeoxyribonuclease III